MANHRIYQDSTLAEELTLPLDKRAAHHLTTVLRANTGDSVVLFNGDGSEYQARLQIKGKSASATIAQQLRFEYPPLLSITFIQAVSRGDRMDWSIQKAVELGASQIIPIYCERSIRSLDKTRTHKKMQHWQGIVTSACEQSERCRLPKLHQPIALSEYLNHSDSSLPGFILDPKAAISLHSSLQAADTVTIFNGPEGGFTDAEIAAAQSSGFKPVHIGPRILRTETAGIVALAVIQSAIGDLK